MRAVDERGRLFATTSFLPDVLARHGISGLEIDHALPGSDPPDRPAERAEGAGRTDNGTPLPTGSPAGGAGPARGLHDARDGAGCRGRRPESKPVPPGAAPPSRGRPDAVRPARHVGTGRQRRAPDLILGGPRLLRSRPWPAAAAAGDLPLGHVAPAGRCPSRSRPHRRRPGLRRGGRAPPPRRAAAPGGRRVGRDLRGALRRRRLDRRHAGAAPADPPRVAAGARRAAAGERRAPGGDLGRAGPGPRALGRRPSTPTCRTRPRSSARCWRSRAARTSTSSTACGRTARPTPPSSG